jgi:hypothetical protein
MWLNINCSQYEKNTRSLGEDMMTISESYAIKLAKQYNYINI